MKKRLKPGWGTAAAVAAGLVLGKLLMDFLLAQPWWPLSVSGEKEVVIRGELTRNEPGETSGFGLKTSVNKELIDLNRFPAETIDIMINRAVVVRGVRREGRLSILDDTGKYKVGSVVEASWTKPN